MDLQRSSPTWFQKRNTWSAAKSDSRLQDKNIECSIVGNHVRAVFTFWMDEAVKRFTAYSISSIGMFFLLVEVNQTHLDALYQQPLQGSLIG